MRANRRGSWAAHPEQVGGWGHVSRPSYRWCVSLLVLILSACVDPYREAANELATMCIAYDHLRLVAQADTTTGESAADQHEADRLCESVAIQRPVE